MDLTSDMRMCLAISFPEGSWLGMKLRCAFVSWECMGLVVALAILGLIVGRRAGAKWFSHLSMWRITGLVVFLAVADILTGLFVFREGSLNHSMREWGLADYAKVATFNLGLSLLLVLVAVFLLAPRGNFDGPSLLRKCGFFVGIVLLNYLFMSLVYVFLSMPVVE